MHRMTFCRMFPERFWQGPCNTRDENLRTLEIHLTRFYKLYKPSHARPSLLRTPSTPARQSGEPFSTALEADHGRGGQDVLQFKKPKGRGWWENQVGEDLLANLRDHPSTDRAAPLNPTHSEYCDRTYKPTDRITKSQMDTMKTNSDLHSHTKSMTSAMVPINGRTELNSESTIQKCGVLFESDSSTPNYGRLRKFFTHPATCVVDTLKGPNLVNEASLQPWMRKQIQQFPILGIMRLTTQLNSTLKIILHILQILDF